MIYLSEIKDKIKKGYYIQEEKYENGVKIYELQKRENEESCLCSFQFNKRFANKLVKETGVKLQSAEKITCALNFVPTAIKNNCARYYTKKTINISKF